MADYITKFRTSSGDKQIDFNALANLPVVDRYVSDDDRKYWDGKMNYEDMLTDETAAMYNLGTDVVPDDVFAYLGKYSQHWWRRKLYNFEVRLGEVEDIVLGSSSDRVYITYSSSYTYTKEAGDKNNDGHFIGTITLIEPVIKEWSNKTSSYNYDTGEPINTPQIVGKYIQLDDNIYLVTDGIWRKSTGSSGYYELYVKGQLVYVDVASSDWEYLRSTDENAYPKENSGDYTYEYFGIPFDNAVRPPQIAHGTYVGTGSWSKTLTFTFSPRLVVIMKAGATTHQGIIWVYGCPNAHNFLSNSQWSSNIEWEFAVAGKSFTCSGYTEGHNASGTTYYYFAIG